MKLAPIVLGAGAALVAGLYLTGRLPGFGAAPANTLPDPTTQAAAAGHGLLDQLAAHGISWPMLAVPAILATVAVITWRRIGGWGRAVVLVLAAVAATLVVVH